MRYVTILNVRYEIDYNITILKNIITSYIIRYGGKHILYFFGNFLIKS